MVIFEPGILIVQPKPVDVVWNTDGTIIYTGKEVNVTAELSGVLFKDECKAVVEDGTLWNLENIQQVLSD